MRIPPATDLQGLPPQALAVIEQMQRHIEQQGLALAEHERSLLQPHAVVCLDPDRGVLRCCRR